MFHTTKTRYTRATPKIVKFYTDLLVHAHAEGVAEQMLRVYLNNIWQESTIACYA
jgi:hypothetical protein